MSSEKYRHAATRGAVFACALMLASGTVAGAQSRQVGVLVRTVDGSPVAGALVGAMSTLASLAPLRSDADGRVAFSVEGGDYLTAVFVVGAAGLAPACLAINHSADEYEIVLDVALSDLEANGSEAGRILERLLDAIWNLAQMHPEARGRVGIQVPGVVFALVERDENGNVVNIDVKGAFIDAVRPFVQSMPLEYRGATVTM